MAEEAQWRNKQSQVRQKALQDELRELIDLVGPVPLVDLLFERAFQLNATDIHMDPTPMGLRIRVRVDGILHDVLDVPEPLTGALVNRVKLMAGENIVERRVAQDGHIVAQHQGRPRDIRVGSGPTIHGERLVLRLMPDSESFLYLDQLGMDLDQVKQLKYLLGLPFGVLLSVGPVGSGKSTTMYSCLEGLNDPTKSLVTIEDPVERHVRGVNQVQIDPKIGFNFVDALKGVLRQDPNVMMIGEIRDPETAHIGIRAGRTGVLVLSTMHSNDAASSIDMLRDFNISPLFIADGVQAIVSQRLMRQVCRHCRVTYRPDAAACEILGIDSVEATRTELVRGEGCEACFRTGYQGRVGVFEILRLDEDLRQGIIAGLSRAQISAMARSKGMRTLHESAVLKVRSGTSTLEELDRLLRCRND